MIPRLFSGSATTFTTNGITALTDAISCTVTEERNGAFELEMVVSTTTPYYSQIEVGALVLAKPNHTQGIQAFEIYEISKPIDQKVTIRANHISYRTSFIPIKPFSATGITATIAGLATNAEETDPFTISSDLTNEASTYNQIEPASLRSRLGGTQGSLLDVFGGEYLWDNFTIYLKAARGADNGVQLRLAKNITDLEQTIDFEKVVTGALPYWVSQDGLTALYGDIQYSAEVNTYAYARTVLLDLSDEFENTPSYDQLNNAAQQYLLKASLALPNTNVSVSFVDLADTTEYANSPLERVNLCDTVEIVYPALGISFKEKCIKVIFDVLAERTLEVEVGDARSNMASTLTDFIGDSTSVITIGKKLVSVTQWIDRELGSITSQVTSVQAQANENGENIITLSNTITQLDESLQIDIGRLEQQVGENTNDISEMHEYFKFELDGLHVSNSGSDIEGVFGNSSLNFTDGTNTLAWVDATDGMGATQLSLGDATQQTKRWMIKPSADANHLFFLRRS